jgi:hypothetical protein
MTKLSGKSLTLPFRSLARKEDEERRGHEGKHPIQHSKAKSDRPAKAVAIPFGWLKSAVATDV